MKYLVILMILFPLVVFSGVPGPNPTGPSTPGPNPSQGGYLTKNCDNKCSKNQRCLLDTANGMYSCGVGEVETATGYKGKNCDNKCTTTQRCTLSIDDGRYYCNNTSNASKKMKQDCELSCKKNEQCIEMKDDSWKCFPSNKRIGNMPEPGPAGIGISVTCQQIGGVSKNKCSLKDVLVEKLNGDMDIAIANTKEQCCIPKARLRLR